MQDENGHRTGIDIGNEFFTLKPFVHKLNMETDRFYELGSRDSTLGSIITGKK